jgi:hypothetical protein
MLAYESHSRHNDMLQRLQMLNSKTDNLNGLREFDGNHLELLLKRRRERLQCDGKVVAEEVEIIKKGRRHRDIDVYDPRVSRESNWYSACVGPRSELCMNPLKKRRRFRMPMKQQKFRRKNSINNRRISWSVERQDRSEV